jgi:hypothetical protein
MKISGLDLILGIVAGFSGVIEKNSKNSRKTAGLASRDVNPELPE